MSLDVYSTDQHLGVEDDELFTFKDSTWLRLHRLARQDINRDLLRRGFDGIKQAHFDDIVDGSVKALVTLKFTATSGGSLVVPAGSKVGTEALATRTNGVVEFVTDAALTVLASQTGTVGATATSAGEPWNVEVAKLVHFRSAATPANFSAVTNDAAPTTLGVDHQLTRAAMYRAMEMVYADLMRTEKDAFDLRRGIYGKRYEQELERLWAAGLTTTRDAYLDTGYQDRKHGWGRLERG